MENCSRIEVTSSRCWLGIGISPVHGCCNEYQIENKEKQVASWHWECASDCKQKEGSVSEMEVCQKWVNERLSIEIADMLQCIFQVTPGRSISPLITVGISHTQLQSHQWHSYPWRPKSLIPHCQSGRNTENRRTYFEPDTITFCIMYLFLINSFDLKGTPIFCQ